MKNEQLKPIIDEILKDYFNRATRLRYNTRTQENMIAQNCAVCNACSAVITFSDNESELVEYTKQRIEEVNEGEAQKIVFNELVVEYTKQRIEEVNEGEAQKVVFK